MSGFSIHKASAALEWRRVQQHLAELAGSDLGRAACTDLELHADPARIERALAEVSEARELLDRGVNVGFSDLVETVAIGKRARVGSGLDGQELLTVGRLLRLSRKTRKLLEAENDRLPLLAQRGNLLPAEVPLEKNIFARLERDGRVSDNASPELRQLRDRYRIVHDQIHVTLDRMITGTDYEDALQEKLFTLRNGRFVVPVKAERKGQVEGIIHDISQTGQSVFIEPRQITQLNNSLRTAELEIEREIFRILLELTYQVAEVIDELDAAVDTLTALDVIFAKARFAIVLKANPVEVARSGAVVLPAARHPLLALQTENVIPNDINMDQIRTLVLSGPNTGGKTVLLKSVGLCALMLRAGMHLPCGPDGRMPVFKRIFAVIGDQQSIENNLSSFSSHLLNLKDILDELVPDSLVLIDEIGEGTDPAQGTALAKAILDKLHAGHARTLVTTHLADLMAAAQVAEGWGNAAMAFDEASMTPTYQLLTGSPGRSSAFAVAQRLGLPPEVVQAARAYASGTDSKLGEVIGKLEEERQRWMVATNQAEKERDEAAAAHRRQEEILAELRTKKRELGEKQREILQKEMNRARTQIKDIVRELQAKQTIHASEDAKTKLRQVKQRMDEILPPVEEEPIPEHLEPIDDWQRLEPGASIHVRPLKESGTLLECPDSHGRVKVEVRGKRLTLPADQCLRHRGQAPGDDAKPARGGVVLVGEPDEDELTRLDLRGQVGDDAVMETERFLDQAGRLGLPSVTIVHGHGTGVLKRMVREYLKGCPYARRWRPGERGEGGDGATIVELDI